MIVKSRRAQTQREARSAADLAVDPNAQKTGIGKRLVELTKEAVGDESMVLLLSVPTAMEYYPKIGMERLDNAFIIWREK